METKKVSISSVKGYWRNPRVNTKAIDAVVASVKEYGYVAPIVVDSSNVIIAGHTRYQALAKLGYDEIDVVVANLPAAKAREYRIIDNKTSELATWDKDKLVSELRDLDDILQFEEFFPELKLGSIDKESFIENISEISEDDIKKTEDRLDSHFHTESTSNSPDRIKTTVCPHCGEEFEMYV